MTSESLGRPQTENMDESPQSPDRTLQVRTTVHYTISEDYTNKGRAVDSRLCALSDKHPTAAPGHKDGDSESTLTIDTSANIAGQSTPDGSGDYPYPSVLSTPSDVLDDFDFDTFLNDDNRVETTDFDGGFVGLDKTEVD